MKSFDTTATLSRASLWTGRLVTAVPALFLLIDGVMKLFKPAFVVQATEQLGFAESVIVPLGVVLTACTIIYLIPLTSIFGAILLTGYLGGAVATQVRMNQGLFPIFFPVIMGALLWLGLYFRDARLQALVPIRKVT